MRYYIDFYRKLYFQSSCNARLKILRKHINVNYKENFSKKERRNFNKMLNKIIR